MILLTGCAGDRVRHSLKIRDWSCPLFASIPAPFPMAALAMNTGPIFVSQCRVSCYHV